ncbi:MAG: N-acetyltransferase [Alcaligenaceae bacterium]|nr:N-acetyltransferase [Alcaligenaceae bacterium]
MDLNRHSSFFQVGFSMNLQYKRFCEINIEDPFFDSLKNDYKEFENWFLRKANDYAYAFYGNNDLLDGFLYLKIEEEELNDITPPLPAARRLKVGTLKINPHGTRLGERFIKKIFDHALYLGITQIYVTVFAHHDALISLLDRYGFKLIGTKTTPNGTETVRLKDLNERHYDVLLDYPRINLEDNQPYLLALYPQWHTRLLPDSILRNEDIHIVQDVSHTNSIHKVYLCNMSGVDRVKRGDPIVIYRTGDGQGAAEYRSVATSLCVIEEYRHISSFESKETFLKYCRPYSVFSENELETFWKNKSYPHIIRFTYNIALNKRIIRKTLADNVGLSRNARWGFLPLSKEQFSHISSIGMIDESLIFD